MEVTQERIKESSSRELVAILGQGLHELTDLEQATIEREEELKEAKARQDAHERTIRSIMDELSRRRILLGDNREEIWDNRMPAHKPTRL